MADLPVMLKVTGRRCVIVGGGSVALRRAKALLRCGADVLVVAKDICRELDELAFALPELRVRRKAYASDDLKNALLVVIATDEEAVNDQVAFDATENDILINRTDAAGAGDITVMAHDRRGPITVAVDSGGASAKASAAIRAALLEHLDPAWVTLVEVAAAYRVTIQNRFEADEARQEALRRLADPEAFRIASEQGPDGLAGYYDRLLAEFDENAPND